MELFEITTTTDAEDAALLIAKTLVEEKLAACVHLEGPIRSFYRWKGKIEDAREWRVCAKTPSELVDVAVSRIKALHNYDVSAILVAAATSVNSDYSQWVSDSVSSE